MQPPFWGVAGANRSRTTPTGEAVLVAEDEDIRQAILIILGTNRGGNG
ncbi:MAG: hypothetical protein R2845_07125 [Thermomicrobiales bacterium]